MPVATKLGDPSEGTTPQGELDQWRQEAERATSKEQRQIIEHNRVKLAAFARALQGHYYYVSCWHMNPHENYGMWKAYAPGSDSVAMRTTLPTLRPCLPDDVDIGMVRYIDYLTARI